MKKPWNSKKLKQHGMVPIPSAWSQGEEPTITRNDYQRHNKTGKYAETGRKKNVIISKARNVGISDMVHKYLDNEYVDNRQETVPDTYVGTYDPYVSKEVAEKRFDEAIDKYSEQWKNHRVQMPFYITLTEKEFNNKTLSDMEEFNEEYWGKQMDKLKDRYARLEYPMTPDEAFPITNGDVSDLYNVSSFVKETPKEYPSIESLSNVNKTTIKVKKLNYDARLPQRMNDTDAGWDCWATSKEELPNNQVKYGLGIAVEIPVGYCLLLFPRSSVYKTGMTLTNSVGVVDAGFRQELSVIFTNGNNGEYNVGDRVCQMLLYKLPEVEFIEVWKLDNTNDRGGGYGSTGTN